MSARTPGRPRRRWLVIAAAAIVALLIAGAAVLHFTGFGKHKITAYFPSTTGLYAGDDVRVLGVDVGKVDKVAPQGESVQVTISVRSDLKVPADAKAVTIAASLVSARFVQLAPVYTGGPVLQDGDVIPLSRTAVPVEWDDIKAELTKLANALGPVENDPEGSFSRFVNTAADNLDGNGDTLRSTLRELSQTISILSDKRTDLFAVIRNLQVFVSALADSNSQIVQFGGRLASVADVLATNSDQLGKSLDELDVAIGDVQRFVADNRAQLGESVARLADATQVLADKRPQLEQVLHLAPTALQNFYQIYKPASGSATGVVVLPNFRNPANFLCGAVAGLQDDDSQKSADLCAQYIAPVLNSIIVNYPPILTNPASSVQAFPSQIEYSPPDLRGSAPVQAPPPPAPSPVPGPPVITVPDLGGLLLPGGGR